jgi:hypothetical protein
MITRKQLATKIILTIFHVKHTDAANNAWVKGIKKSRNIIIFWPSWA